MFCFIQHLQTEEERERAREREATTKAGGEITRGVWSSRGADPSVWSKTGPVTTYD